MMCVMRAVGAMLLIAGLVGCGPSPNAPRITRLQFTRQDAEDPYRLSFQVGFVDSNADLADGRVFLWLNDRRVAERAMTDVFAHQPVPIPPDTTEGEFEIVARVSDEVSDGERIEFGFMLEDGAGHQSNRPTVALRVRLPGGS